MACNRCGRPLSDPESIKRGLGPVCFGKENEAAGPRQRSLFDMKPKTWMPEEIKIPVTGTGKKYVLLVGYQDHFVNVVDDKGPRSLKHIVHHSPDGMTFGYAGSGPCDCARSILADCAGMAVADTYYMDFKDEHIAGISQKRGGEISEEDILKWLQEKAAEDGDSGQ